MKLIKELKGTNGKIYVYEDRIVISRNTFGGISAFGIVGEKTYFYNSLQGIEFSGGLLRIIPKGCDISTYKSISFSDIRKAQKDSNVILVGTKIKLAQQICEIITKKVNQIYSNNKEVVANSVADEILKFKELLDEGIITQEEFDKKKQELLEKSK